MRCYNRQPPIRDFHQSHPTRGKQEYQPLYCAGDFCRPDPGYTLVTAFEPEVGYFAAKLFTTIIINPAN